MADKHHLQLNECVDPDTKKERKDKGITDYENGSFDFDEAYNAGK